MKKSLNLALLFAMLPLPMSAQYTVPSGPSQAGFASFGNLAPVIMPPVPAVNYGGQTAGYSPPGTANAPASYTYAYDANGNMTFDGRKGLEYHYNYLNLLEKAEATIPPIDPNAPNDPGHNRKRVIHLAR